jgi:hypothetical protein
VKLKITTSADGKPQEQFLVLMEEKHQSRSKLNYLGGKNGKKTYFKIVL